MKVGTMAVGQVSRIPCTPIVSRSCCCSGNLQKSVVVWAIPLCRPSRINSALSFARPSCNLGLNSSHCVLQGSRYIKSVNKDSSTPGNLWQRRMQKGGGIRCQLGGASPSQDDEIGRDSNVPFAPVENDTVQFDLNLPRRSLLLEFTCNVCQARTQRMINPDAFRRGTVYVQCGGCEAYHQLVDNLNLVKEHDFRTEVERLWNDLGV